MRKGLKSGIKKRLLPFLRLACVVQRFLAPTAESKPIWRALDLSNLNVDAAQLFVFAYLQKKRFYD